MSVIEREQEQVLVDPVREGRARVLEAAALEIEVRGWCQRKLEDGAGRVCAIETIDKVMPGVWPPVVGLSAICLVDFNNAPGRTAGEVTFVLRWRAAEIRDGR